MFNFEMLLDPLEEKLNLPPAPVNVAGFLCRDIEVIR
jgi:hypothetical protein